MGGPNGIGFGGNIPRINTQGTENIGNIGGVRVDTTRPGAAPQNIPQHIDIRPQAQPSRAADIVGQLDVLLLKALNGASGEITAEDVEKAAVNAKLPQGIRDNLKSMAGTAQASLAALDKFTGKDLAAAMEKKDNNTVDWKEDSMVAEAFKAAQDAQNALSMALAKALGMAVDGKTQATLEELMLQCDRRVAEIDTLVLQMSDIIDKGGENAQENAAALMKGGTISSFKSDNALEKFGRNEMFNALKLDLKPLTDRLDQYANDGAKDLKKADVKACVRELNAIKAKFSAAAASGTLKVGKTTVFADRTLLDKASKLLDDVGKKIGAFHHDVLHSAMVKLVENEIPFFNGKLFTPKFAGEIGKILIKDPNIKPKALEDYVKLINTFRSAARTYVESPTEVNANKLREAASDLTTVPTDDVAKCLAAPAIANFRAPANASKEFKDALEDFRNHAFSTIQDDQTAFSNLIRAYDHIDIAAEKLIALGKEMNAGSTNKYFVSSAVLDAFRGEMSFSPLIESRVHGYSDSDINIALDDKNVTGAKTLGSGSFNTVTLVTVKDGSQWVFKPELAGRLAIPNSPLSNGMNVNQEITRINLAVQTTADALGLDDIMVNTSVGTHKGQFGMFMEKAPGITGKQFKGSSQTEVKQMDDASFGKVVGNMMRKLNRLQWFDLITGQGDRHAENYMIEVNKDTISVDIKAIDNDASYGIFRQGLHKFFLQGDASMGMAFREALDKLAKNVTIEQQGKQLSGEERKKKIEEAREDFKQNVLNDPGITQRYDGSLTIDLSKAKNPLLLKSLLNRCGIKNIVPPAEIDQTLYDKLMTLAKNAPDGGVERKKYLSSIAQRLGKNSEQYKAAVLRLDESIEHARKLAKEGKVYNKEDWEKHDTQRKIAEPNLANMKQELNMEQELNTDGAKISEKKAAPFAHNGRYVSYSNTFFRDFYDVIIKGSKHENWFSPK